MKKYLVIAMTFFNFALFDISAFTRRTRLTGHFLSISFEERRKTKKRRRQYQNRKYKKKKVYQEKRYKFKGTKSKNVRYLNHRKIRRMYRND